MAHVRRERGRRSIRRVASVDLPLFIAFLYQFMKRTEIFSFKIEIPTVAYTNKFLMIYILAVYNHVEDEESAIEQKADGPIKEMTGVSLYREYIFEGSRQSYNIKRQLDI